MSLHQTRAGRCRDAMVEGEYALTPGDFRRIAAMLHGDAGIVLHEGKATLVYSRLAKRLRALGLGSFAAYCDLLDGPDGEDERREMLAALTTNVTRFFREPHHFDHLRTRILPRLLEGARSGRRVRLWSAAASSGQEAFSMAMTVLQVCPEAAEYDVRILATDIDPKMVQAGRAGRFSAHAAEGISPELRRRWFLAAEDGALQARPELLSLVTYRELNLLGEWPMRGRFDAVFCRNVVIYFDEATQAALWARMPGVLQPEGALYIGHSERIGGPASGQFRSEGITTYRLAGAAA